MFFVIEKLFDKLSDIMGPILPPLDQENENRNAVNVVLTNRSSEKIWGEWGEETQNKSFNVPMKYTHSYKSFARWIFPSQRWG